MSGGIGVPLPSPPSWQRVSARRLFVRQHRPPSPDDEIITAFRDGEVTARANRRLEGFTNAAQEIGYQGIRRGDLVIHSMDGFAGAIGISDSSGKASPVVHAYTARGDVEPRFFAYMLRSMAASGFISSLARGIRERSSAFDASTFEALMLPVPGWPVQRAVSDYLDRETTRIDALITAKRRMVVLVTERLQRVLSDATHARAAIEGSSRLPTGWTQMQLKRCLRSTTYGIGDSTEDVGEYAVLGMSNIGAGEVCGPPAGFASRVRPELLLAPGDLLFNRTNSRDLVGKVGLVRGALKKPTTFASYLVRLRPNDLALAGYLNYLLNTREVLGLARSMALPSIGQANLNPSRYSAIILPMPPVEEQRRIAGHLDGLAEDARGVMRLLERQIGLLRERRLAIVEAAVTGQLDIPEAA